MTHFLTKQWEAELAILVELGARDRLHAAVWSVLAFDGDAPTDRQWADIARRLNGGISSDQSYAGKLLVPTARADGRRWNKTSAAAYFGVPPIDEDELARRGRERARFGRPPVTLDDIAAKLDTIIELLVGRLNV